MVYRIQDSQGRGPFKPGFTQMWLSDRDDLDELLPMFMDPKLASESLIHVKGLNMGCACISPEQLKRWFTESEYRKLLSYGYKAVRMTVETAIEGEVQCLIRRSKPFWFACKPFNLYPGPPAVPHQAP